MTWYTASIIMSIRTIEPTQTEIPVYENFVLIEGKTPEEALRKAVEIGENEEKYNDDMTINDKPAKMVYEGIRKLINVSNPDQLDLDNDRPISGTELTYSQYVLENEEQLDDLINGRELLVKYIE